MRFPSPGWSAALPRAGTDVASGDASSYRRPPQDRRDADDDEGAAEPRPLVGLVLRGERLDAEVEVGAVVDDGRVSAQPHPPQLRPRLVVSVGEQRDARVAFDVREARKVAAALRLVVDGGIERVAFERERDRDEVRARRRRRSSRDARRASARSASARRLDRSGSACRGLLHSTRGRDDGFAPAAGDGHAEGALPRTPRDAERLEPVADDVDRLGLRRDVVADRRRDGARRERDETPCGGRPRSRRRRHVPRRAPCCVSACCPSCACANARARYARERSR